MTLLCCLLHIDLHSRSSDSVKSAHSRMDARPSEAALAEEWRPIEAAMWEAGMSVVEANNHIWELVRLHTCCYECREVARGARGSVKRSSIFDSEGQRCVDRCR